MTAKKNPGLGFMVDGKWQKFEWSNLAKLTAEILSHLPTEPPKTHMGPGLLGPIVDTEPTAQESELLERYLVMVAGISAFIQRYASFRAHKLGEPDSSALVTAWAHLDFICSARYVPPDILRNLPIDIAAITQSANTANALRAKNPRPNVDRRGPLAKAVSKERGRDRFATAMEVLDRLCGGDVVKECKDGHVWYWNETGDLTSVGLDRFETIFSEQRPSTG